MSTLKTTNLQSADASSANIILGQGSGGGATISGVTTATTLRATTGIITSFSGDITIDDKIIHSGDTDTTIRFPSANTVTVETAGSERIRIKSDGKIGIGGASNDPPGTPDGNVHIQDSNAGSVTADADADQLVLESSGNTGMSFLSPGTGESSIYFGNSGTNGQKDGWIKYYHETHSTTANRRSLSFKTGGGDEKMFLSSDGDLIVGGHNAVIEPMTYDSSLEILGNSTYRAGLTILRYSTDTVGPQIILGKSKNATIGSNSTVSENDSLGHIIFSGTDTNWEPGASILAAADGEWLTGGDNTDTPGRLVFNTTPNGSDDLAERMRICANGTVTFRIGAPYSIYPTAGTSTGECGFQFKQTAGFARGFALLEERGDSNGMDLIIAKSRDSNGSGGVGSINSGDTLGFLRYTGADGAKQITAAGILVWNTGTVATDRVAGRMGFYTHPDSTSTHASRMVIDESGNIGAPNQGTNIYNASDERVKENMVELTDGLSKVKQLKPISFTWKDNFCESENGLTQYGFGAQTTQAVDELLVQPFGEGDIEFNGETIENPLRVNEKFIIPLLVKAIQEQQEQIETLKTKVAALESA